MAGCFGNDPEDKHYENQMLEHVDPEEFVCDKCAETTPVEDLSDRFWHQMICIKCEQNEEEE